MGRDAVELTVTLDCAPPDGPGAIATVRWHWRDGEFLAGATDGLVVTWTGEVTWDPAATSWSPPYAIWEGGGSPSAALIDRIDGERPTLTFGIDVARTGLMDGSVTVRLLPTAVGSPRPPVTIDAAYAHLDRWLVRSDPVSCPTSEEAETMRLQAA